MKKISILCFFLLIFSLMSVCSATYVYLCDGYRMDIPSEYDAEIGSNGQVIVDARPYSMINIDQAELTSNKEKVNTADALLGVKDYRIIHIGNYDVLEYKAKPQPDGSIVYGYFIDDEGSTIAFTVNVNPEYDWDVTDYSNPIHRIIANN